MGRSSRVLAALLLSVTMGLAMATGPAAAVVSIVPTEPPLFGIGGIAAGGNHTCALLDDRTVKCWGRNTSGQLGIDSTTDQKKPNLAVRSPMQF